MSTSTLQENNTVKENIENDIKEIDTCLKRIEASGLVAKYKEATKKDSIILYEKKKDSSGSNNWTHFENITLTALFKKDDNTIDLQVYDHSGNFERGGKGHNTSTNGKLSHWDTDTTKHDFNGHHRIPTNGVGKAHIAEYKKYVLKLEEKLERHTKRAKIISKVKNGILSIFSKKN